MQQNTLVLMIAILGLAACDTGPKSSAGFRLPDGDAAAGKVAFVELQCTSCHTVKGVTLSAEQEPGSINVDLGGTTYRVKTYGDLVTSIINPSHKLAANYEADEIAVDGESRMSAYSAIYNDVMTVQQVVDLVAFLQSHYDVVVPKYQYPPYGY